jgi:hypothetical protein
MTPEKVRTYAPPPAGLCATSSAPASEPPETLRQLVDAYMPAYASRDRSRVAQLARWCEILGDRQYITLTDDDVFHAHLHGEDSILELRHPGHGWVAFVIPQHERANIVSLLLHHALLPKTAGEQVPAPGPSSSGGKLH